MTFTWSNGTPGTAADYSWPEAGLYTITVTATNPCDVVVTGTLQVNVTCRALSLVNIAGPPVLLVGEVGSYTASYLPLNATEPVTITWDDGTVGYTNPYSWTEPGWQTITVTATNPCDVVVTGTLAVSVTRCKALTDVEIAGPEVLLVDELGTYTATWLPENATEPVTVTWDNGTVGVYHHLQLAADRDIYHHGHGHQPL